MKRGGGGGEGRSQRRRRRRQRNVEYRGIRVEWITKKTDRERERRWEREKEVD